MMKKLLKITSLIAIVVMALLALTGCGGKKLVGNIKEDDYKVKLVATFDSKDRLKTMTMTATYKDTDDAKDAYDSAKDLYEFGKVKRSGKKVTVTIKGKELAEELDKDYDDIDRDYVEKFAETMGFDIKD